MMVSDDIRADNVAELDDPASGQHMIEDGYVY
jgi:hypothetical protein